MKKYTKTDILCGIGILLILILLIISFVPLSNFVLKTTNNALKEGTLKKKEMGRVEAYLGVATVNGKILKEGSKVIIEYNNKNKLLAIFLGFNKLSNLYEFEKKSQFFKGKNFTLRMRELSLNDRKIYAEV